MLAKVWKKALLAICIIACIYNVMYKLISRTSLEVQLRSVQNQTSLIDGWNKDEVKEETFDNNEIDSNAVKEQSSKGNETIVVIY